MPSRPARSRRNLHRLDERLLLAAAVAVGILSSSATLGCGESAGPSGAGNAAATAGGGHAAGGGNTGGGGAHGGADAGGSGAAGGGGSVAELVDCASVEPAASVEMVLPDFVPLELTIAAGAVVEFDNPDSVAHTATTGTATPAGGQADGRFDTGLIGPGESACVRINAPGSYGYFCGVHPTMQATILVQ